MTIDEDIENLKKDYEIDMYIRYITQQIAEWLEELKEYKKNSNTCPMCDTYCSYIAEEFENGYNKAIDDFVKELQKKTEKDLANPDLALECKKCGIWKNYDIEEIAEQLKAGGENE